MKYTAVSIAALSLLQLASAQPYQRRHAHQAAHVKKEIVQVTNTVVAVATEEPEVVVYVDQKGAALSTVTVPATIVSITTHISATPTLAPVVPTTAPAAVIPAVAIVSSIVAPLLPTSAVIPVPAASPVASSGHGFSYTPYSSNGDCKTADQVSSDVAMVNKNKEYSYMRTYGTDCNTLANVLPAAKANGLQLLAGFFALATVNAECTSLITAVGGDWSSIKAVTVGNELVNSGQASPSEVMSAVAEARTQLRAAGYQGPVGTVDTMSATQANPELCDGSDICTINCHPFFDPNTAPENAGEFITNAISTLKGKLANSGQTILISETGWPHQGTSNGLAVPSLENQATAINSIKTAFSGNPGSVVLFTPFDTQWKKAVADTFFAEPYWGFVGPDPSG